MGIRKKILFTAPYFPPHSGGLERYVNEIAARLSSSSVWDVVVLTTAEVGAKSFVDKRGRVTVLRLPYAFKISNTPFSFLWLFKIPLLIRSINPDVINIHTPVPGLGDLVALSAGKRPVFVTYHAGSMKKGTWFPDVFVSLYEHGPLRLLLSHARHIFCSSDAVRFNFLGKYISKSSTITPGVNVATFYACASKRSPLPTVLFVGGLGKSEQYKGVRVLLEAIKKVKESLPTVQLLLVGEGDMIPTYKEITRTLGLENNVVFKGKLLGVELTECYQSAHVFALPSSNDSSPMVITEAMACALPVVSTTVGGIPNLVEDGVTGYLVEPHDVEAFSERLSKLLNEPKMAIAMGKAGRGRAVMYYSWDERVFEYENAFLKATKKPKPTIVQINPHYPPHLGGVEQVVEKASQHLAADGQSVIVITSNNSFKTTTQCLPNLTIERLAKLEIFNVPFAPSLLFHLLRLPKHSLIHVHLTQAYWPERVLLVSKVRQIPYVAHFHLDIEASSWVGGLFKVYKKIVWGPFLRQAKMVIVCSPEQISIVEKKYKVPLDRITVIPNAVSDEFFFDRKSSWPQDKLKLLYVGRLAVQKRVERLIEVMSKLIIPAELTIVGDGNLRADLEALARSKGLTNVTFFGSRNHQEIIALCRTHDVFVISSDREGLPLVVLEAMASGLPVVGTNVVGITNVLTDTGILVEKPYEENFTLALSKLWNTKTLLPELSAKSSLKAKQHTWAIFMERLNALYCSVYSL